MAGQERPGSRQERRRQQRRQRVAPRQPQNKRRLWWIAGAAVVVLAIIVLGGYAVAQRNGNTQTAASIQPGDPIDGIQCGTMEGQAEHIHSHLGLFWNGKAVTIPADVGIPVNQNINNGYCYYWLHTHAPTNVIHVEAPASGTYTLGEFFDIWRYTALWDRQSTLNGAPKISVAFPDAIGAAQPGSIHVYVGNKEVRTPYRDVTLADHKNITIELGTPLKPPVATFDWTHWNGL